MVNLNSTSLLKYIENRELGERTSTRQYKKSRIIENIKALQANGKIIHTSSISKFFIQDPWALTCRENSRKITLWNLETAKYHRHFYTTHKFNISLLNLHKDKIICAGMHDTMACIIEIIDISSETSVIIQDSTLWVHKICVIANKIFSYLDDGYIGKWDFNGEMIDRIEAINCDSDHNNFFNVDSLLFITSKNAIIVHDTETNSTKTIKILSSLEITSTLLENSRLFCGCSDNLGSHSLCVVDLEKEIENIKYYSLPNNGQSTLNPIKSIVKKWEWIYLGYANSLICAFILSKEITEKNLVILNADKIVTDAQLILDGSILLEINKFPKSNQKLMTLWDTKTNKRIYGSSFPYLQQVSLVKGKLLAINDKSITSWDYLSNKEFSSKKNTSSNTIIKDKEEEDPDTETDNSDYSNQRDYDTD